MPLSSIQLVYNYTTGIQLAPIDTSVSLIQKWMSHENP
jgi:hypothetical protein